jgi:flavin reductase (DIM6/NTAB) family NADH-FMN oxidoreductase RutF
VKRPQGPSDDRDRLLRRVLWLLPTGLYLVGSASGSRRNLMTANLVVQVATDPRTVGVAVERSALTRELIEASGAFALSVLSRSDRAVVRTFAKPAVPGPAEDELSGHRCLDAPSGAPILRNAIAYLDCRVVSRLDFASHVFFAGEVVDGGLSPAGEVVEGGLGPDGDGVEVLRMEDTRMHYGG